jgi:hypothetical protein
MDAAEILARHFSGRMNRIGVLPDSMVRELLECSIKSRDVTTAQARVLTETLRQLAPSDV